MNDNHYIVEKALLRKGLVSGWYGNFISFPHDLYFISLIEIGPDDYFTYPSIGVAGAYGRAKKAHQLLIEKTEREIRKLGNYIDNIDKMICEKEHSIKINKMDINKCIIPRRYYLQTGTFSHGVINVKTIKKKYEILFPEPKKVIPELKDYLVKNFYSVK